MADKMRATWGRGSLGVVFSLAHKLGFRRLRMCVRPFLSGAHMAARLAWAQELTADQNGAFAEPDTVYVHVDEKWFFTLLPDRQLWVAPGARPPTVHIASKRHIQKAMFLAAVAKPVPERDFDGRIGFYPVAERVTAKRDSKAHKKGDALWKPIEMDAALFKAFIKEKVVPDALRATGAWARKIIVQMDNAGGHGGGRGDMSKTTLAKLNAWAAVLPAELRELCPQGPPVFEFVAQPPRSPGLNVLDLGAWNSLQVAVDNTKREGNTSATVTELFDRCIDAWAKWPAAQVLTKLFSTLSAVLSQVKEARGGNEYALPHQTDTKIFS